MIEPNTAKTLNQLASECHQIAIEHGWWESKRNFGELCALIHSEVSEMLEAWRKGKPDTEVMVEAADIIIRVLDLAASEKWDMDAAVRHKMAVNKGRAHRHGGLKA